MANGVYQAFKKGIVQGSYNLNNLPVWVALVTSSYTPDFDTHAVFSTLAGGEVAATTGYAEGGLALSSAHVYQDDTNNYAVLRGSSMLWASSCITCRGAVLYGSTGLDGTSPLVAYFDFTTDKVSASPGYLQIDWNAAGILALT